MNNLLPYQSPAKPDAYLETTSREIDGKTVHRQVVEVPGASIKLTKDDIVDITVRHQNAGNPDGEPYPGFYTLNDDGVTDLNLDNFFDGENVFTSKYNTFIGEAEIVFKLKRPMIISAIDVETVEPFVAAHVGSNMKYLQDGTNEGVDVYARKPISRLNFPLNQIPSNYFIVTLSGGETGYEQVSVKSIQAYVSPDPVSEKIVSVLEETYKYISSGSSDMPIDKFGSVYGNWFFQEDTSKPLTKDNFYKFDTDTNTYFLSDTSDTASAFPIILRFNKSGQKVRDIYVYDNAYGFSFVKVKYYKQGVGWVYLYDDSDQFAEGSGSRYSAKLTLPVLNDNVYDSLYIEIGGGEYQIDTGKYYASFCSIKVQQVKDDLADQNRQLLYSILNELKSLNNNLNPPV